MKLLNCLNILFLLTLCSCTGCEEEPFPELPEETQRGAKTFGCLVNNELVFAWFMVEGSYKTVDAIAKYNTTADQLTIEADCQFGQKFSFCINHPTVNHDMPINAIRYLPPRSDQWMEAENTGNIRITRLDKELYYSGIASGVFSFDLNEGGRKPVHVAKGRFDLEMYIHP